MEMSTAENEELVSRVYLRTIEDRREGRELAIVRRAIEVAFADGVPATDEDKSEQIG